MPDQEVILSDASVEVDDVPWTVEGNTIVLVEGQGTFTTKSASRGSRPVSVHSLDASTLVGMVKFEKPMSVVSANRTRDTKALGPGRVVRVSGTDPDGNRLGRTLNHAVLANDAEKAVQNEGKLPVEFSGDPLIAS